MRPLSPARWGAPADGSGRIHTFAAPVRGVPRGRSAYARCASEAGPQWAREFLDVIDRTPALDIKSYVSEFVSWSAVRQPSGSHELMSGYW